LTDLLDTHSKGINISQKFKEIYTESIQLIRVFLKFNGLTLRAEVIRLQLSTVKGARQEKRSFLTFFWLKVLDIKYSGTALGKPSAKSQTAYRKRKFKEEQGMRNLPGSMLQCPTGHHHSHRLRVQDQVVSRIEVV
jgi:hypothetical protein